MPEADVIRITSERQFYQLVQQIEAGEIEPPNIGQWKFEGWPNVSIVVDGERYHSSLTPGLLQGLLDFQTELYRAYAQIKYNSPNLQRLTNAEKKSLELVFHVSEGSSDNSIDASEFVNKVIENGFEVVNSMPPETQLVVVIAVILGVSGTYLVNKGLNVWQGKIEADREQHREEQETERHRDALAQMKELALRKVESSNVAPAQKFLEHTNEAYRSVARRVPDAASIAMAGRGLTDMEREFLTSSEGVRRERDEITSEVIVDGLKHGDEAISIQVTRVDREDNSFTLKANKNLIQPDEVDALLKAWKTQRPIKIKHHALMESSDVVHSQFMCVVRPTPTTSSEAANA